MSKRSTAAASSSAFADLNRRLGIQKQRGDFPEVFHVRSKAQWPAMRRRFQNVVDRPAAPASLP